MKFSTRTGLALLAFGAVAAFLSMTEHRAHLFGPSPYLFLLVCVLLHRFMHAGHSGHRASDDSSHGSGHSHPEEHREGL